MLGIIRISFTSSSIKVDAFTEKVDFIPERVDFLYSQLACFVQFCEDFRIKMYYFQLFFVSLYTICPMLGKNN